MPWLKHLHEHHLAILHLLAKLEGNIRQLEIGEFNEGVFWDFKEFAEVITKELIPHFQDEEKNAYVLVASMDENKQKFIDNMIEEHRILNAAFETYLRAVGTRNISGLVDSGKVLINLLKSHIEKEENVIMPIIHRRQGNQ
ncbi:MAG: hemerythrin domain-containing protein [Peptococcaceae bacterium]|nr:MAG: hemerythrin domain-containing protein [Peptococcaceae bacterium]